MKNVVMLNDDCNSANKKVNEAYEDEKFNQAYANFIEQGKNKGLDIVIAHFSDYKEGTIKNGWTRQKGFWKKTGKLPIEFMYNKFSTKTKNTKTIKKDLQNRGINMLNHPDFESMLEDKQTNYEAFPEVIPLTVSIKGKTDEIIQIIKKMRKQLLHKDLNTNKIFMKPRFGFGGKKIIIIDGENYSELKNIENQEYIAQPFLESSKGISELGIIGRHDFRIISVNGNNEVAYVRTPPKQGLISNESYGGDIEYFDITKVPKEFTDVIKLIDSKLTRFNPRIYSVDMAKGISGKIWVYEMNGKPGQAWDPNNKSEIENTKKLQNAILEVLVKSVHKK